MPDGHVRKIDNALPRHDRPQAVEHEVEGSLEQVTGEFESMVNALDQDLDGFVRGVAGITHKDAFQRLGELADAVRLLSAKLNA